MADEQLDIEHDEEEAERPTKDLFTLIRQDGRGYLQMDSHQVGDFLFSIDYLLRPQVTYRVDNEHMIKQILYRNMIVASFFLNEIRKTLPDNHRARKRLDSVWDDLEESIQKSGPRFGEKIDELREHGWRI